jgi:sugar phosphate isomerase/epimerase
MMFTRRTFLAGTAAGLAGTVLMRDLPAGEGAGAGGGGLKYRIGSRTGCYGDKFEIAKKAGIEGVELGVGGPADKLAIANPERIKKHQDETKAAGLVVCSLSMDLLNGNPLATHPKAPAWLEQTIDAAGLLGAAGILVPFFGQGSLLDDKELKKADVANVVSRMKDAAPKAKAAGVMLGLENTCSAKQNLDILDRIGSDAVGCYYDIGNSTENGYDVPAEIRALAGRIAMFHFKDGDSYVGEGTVKLPPIAEAIKAIKYKGWIVLETACPTKNPEADAAKNVQIIRKALG